jgi:hypothetical protein
MKSFVIHDYQKQKSFSSFLPGIAGLQGLPMWAFYVNRGQALSSFGVRDKNGAITEFYPANLAYAYVHQHGFRTFIKLDQEVFECFQEKHSTHQTMTISGHELILEEMIPTWQIKIVITYATLPEMPLSALMRKVDIVNLSKQTKSLVIVDGLSQMLPAGIDYGGYKAISNLLQSWMEVEEKDQYVFLRLRASTADSSEVKLVEEGHFYTYIGLPKVHYLYDYKAVFALDRSFQTPYQLMNLDYSAFISQKQAPVNQVPSAFASAEITLKDQVTFFGLFGYSAQRDRLTQQLGQINSEVIQQKFKQNADLILGLNQDIHTETNQPLFDAYLKQCYLDNILRGGYPISFKTLDGDVAYHVYSRKHGDLERDYNFFSIESTYLSQGNGAFRDVLQNRRNDLYFHPEAGKTTIAQFMSLLQADGYNPLSVEGIYFTFAGNPSQYPNRLSTLLKGEFTPGQIAMAAEHHQLPVLKTVETILAQCHHHFRATYGEGYWGDHFTYLLDLLETYLDIFPDEVKNLLLSRHRYFVSPASVKKRTEKYVLMGNQVRQYHAVHHDHKQPPRGWLMDQNQQVIQGTLAGKLLTLIANKFAQLDPDEVGLMYEADRPGWNDALNGLPGLFGSGVSELIELKRLLSFFQTYALTLTMDGVLPLAQLLQALIHAQTLSIPFSRWDARMTALETYREAILQPTSLQVMDSKLVATFVQEVTKTLDQSIQTLHGLGPIPPTYFTYQVTDYEPLPKVGDRLFVRVKGFKRMPIPGFLEAPARMLSSLPLAKEKSQTLFDAVLASPIYDEALKLYKTSESLDEQTMEMGRIRAFTPGWLERESAFLHMTYKYFLGLLKAELYEPFFSTIQDGLTCFMNPQVYGRSPLENSSFIATSNNPDASKHGQGFYARLSGSTSEVLSMWKHLFFGRHLFQVKQNQLEFSVRPSLPVSYFKSGVVRTTLFSNIAIAIHYQGQLPTYDPQVEVDYYLLYSNAQGTPIRVNGPKITGDFAQAIRRQEFVSIDVYLKGGLSPLS